jgi:hypothetical protein
MNLWSNSVFTLALVLSFYISYSSIVISNSMALPYLSIQVTENKEAGTFSSLSRNFDQTVADINNDNSSSTAETANDNDGSSTAETANDNDGSSTAETANDNDGSLQE